MNDIEERLHRYRPSGPPAALRGRVLHAVDAPAAATGGRPWLAWVPAAAVAAAIVVFQLLAARVQSDIDSQTADRAREELVDMMTTALGGGDVARQAAEWSVRASEADVKPGDAGSGPQAAGE